MLKTKLTAYPAEIKGTSGVVMEDKHVSDEAIRQSIAELERVASGEPTAVMKWRAEDPVYAAWLLMRQMKHLVARLNLAERVNGDS